MLLATALVATLAFAVCPTACAQAEYITSDGAREALKQGEVVLASSLESSSAVPVAASTEGTRTLLAGSGESSAPSPKLPEDMKEKIRAVFSSSKPKDDSTPAISDKASASTAPGNNGALQPAVEMHGNTRHVMEAFNTPAPPLVADPTKSASSPQATDGTVSKSPANQGNGVATRNEGTLAADAGQN
jgi:hypothetical protein